RKMTKCQMKCRGQLEFAGPFPLESADTIMAQQPTIHNELRAFRARAGWAQTELFRRCGRSGAEIETGRLVPSTSTAVALAGVLGTTVEALFRLPKLESERATGELHGRRRVLPVGTGKLWRITVRRK